MVDRIALGRTDLVFDLVDGGPGVTATEAGLRADLLGRPFARPVG